MTPSSAAAPYRSTPVFDEETVPAALRREHRTKAGVWGVVRILDGELRLTFVDPPQILILSPDRPGLLLPEQLHSVEPLGKVRFKVEFYDELPKL